MTIAACYVSPEGVVLGADSTTTFNNGSGAHYFNNGQKIFELGDGSTLGIVTWGIGNLEDASYRLLFSYLSDDIKRNNYVRVSDVMKSWVRLFWTEYNKSPMISTAKATLGLLMAKSPHNPYSSVLDPLTRTAQEEDQLNSVVNGHTVGFCICGNTPLNRLPTAYSVVFQPHMSTVPPEVLLPKGFSFWRAPNIVQRLIHGYDLEMIPRLIASGKWIGTPMDLVSILSHHQLQHSTNVPIRDAIDFIYACIFSTIKAFKFSTYSQICGGPIETADRPFRWVTP